MERREQMILLLSKVVAGNMSPQMALDEWPKESATDNKLIRDAWHALYHYCIDDDIRAKEPSYGDRQRRVLEEFIEALKHTSH